MTDPHRQSLIELMNKLEHMKRDQLRKLEDIKHTVQLLLNS